MDVASSPQSLPEIQRELNLGHVIKVKADFYDWFYLIWKNEEGKVCVRYGKHDIETFDSLEQVILYYFFRVLAVIEPKENPSKTIPIACDVDEMAC
jgi:hypothetical protein